DEVGGELRQSLIAALGPAIFDRDVLVLEKASLAQTFRNPVTLCAVSSAASWLRNPITGIGCCCARAASGHAAAAPPSSVMNSRRLIQLPRRRGRVGLRRRDPRESRERGGTPCQIQKSSPRKFQS